MGKAYNFMSVVAIILLFSAFSIALLSTPVFATVTLNISANGIALPSAGIIVTGIITNTTTSDVISPINVTANTSTTGSYSITPANGTFYFNLTAPSVTGHYNITVFTNHSTVLRKDIPLFVTNASRATVTFVSSFPPFSAGSTFTINVSLFNGPVPVNNLTVNGSATFVYSPNVSIFSANGAQVSWTIVNNSLGTDNSGNAGFNVTIPSSTAPGSYVVVVDKGVATSVFQVGTAVRIAVNTLTTSDEVVSNLAPSSTVNILAKVRTKAGDSISGLGVHALVTLPDGRIDNVTLSAHPSSAGFYNNTYTNTSMKGTYSVKVVTNYQSSQLESSTTFSTRIFSTRIQTVSSFFLEWGGKGSFKPGQTVGLSIVSTNLTDGTTVSWSSCTGANYTAFDLKLINGTSINSSLTGSNAPAYSTETMFGGTTVCKVTFSNINMSGVYNVKVNVTVADSTETAEGFFTIQNYFLKVTPEKSIGSGEFFSVFAPGDNVSLSLKVLNVTGNVQLLPQNISDFNVTKITPLEFTGGSSEITTLNQSTGTSPSNPSTDPIINLQIPSNVFGPVSVETQAYVNGETVKGTAFFIANYLMGFASPKIGFSTESGGGPGEGAGGFGFGARCSGVVKFSGTVQDAKTGSSAQGASVIGIIQARQEETGKDISSDLTISSSTASDANGAFDVNVSFSTSATFSGFHFVVFNMSFKGNTAGLPAFFECKNLNLGAPTIKAVGTTESFSWQLAPSSGISVSFTNVTNMSGTFINSSITPNITASTLKIPKIFNFNPSSGGMQVLIPNTPQLSVNFSSTHSNGAPTSNNATLTIYPANFTLSGKNLTKWPNGFFDMRPQVVSNLGTDSTFGGFMVVSFTAFPEQFGFGQVRAGSQQSVIIDAQTNVSCGTNDATLKMVCNTTSSQGANLGAFQISLGKPWEGDLLNITPDNATMISDGWNHTANTSFERWNVTYTIPATASKGGSMLTVTVFSNGSSTAGESVDVPLFVSVTKYSVFVPIREDIGQQGTSDFDLTFRPNSTIDNNTINMTYLQRDLGVYPKNSGGLVCVKDRLNVSRNSQIQAYDNDTQPVSLAVIDNANSFTYDTVVINRSSNYTVHNLTKSTAMNITPITSSGALYLWKIEACSFVTIFNSSASVYSSGVGGNVAPVQTNSLLQLPYIVLLGTTPQNGVTADINAIAKQDDRGFGFEKKLIGGAGDLIGSNNNYSRVLNVTGADGVAILRLNVSASGRFMAFWKINTSNDVDTAATSTGTSLQIQSFRTFANPINVFPQGLVTLYYNTSAPWPVNSTFHYNQTVTETAASNFISSGSLDTWFITYNISTNETRLATSIAALASATKNTINTSFTVSGQSVAIAMITRNTTNISDSITDNTNLRNNVTMLFYPDTATSSIVNPASGLSNITVRVCAVGFENPQPVPREGAVVNLSVADWSSFPSTTKYLGLFSVADNSSYSPARPLLTGPGGCAIAHVGPGQLGSWPTSGTGRPPVFVEGTVTHSGTIENVYVMDVFRY